MTGDEIWHSAPAEFVLAKGDVHVWRANLDQPQTCIDQLAQALSADERTRAGRFYFERDRKRFVVARGVLRTLLGRYLNVPAADVQFEYGTHGKPVLARNVHHTLLQFNVSHSQSLALLAFTHGRPVGIDVEFVRLLTDAEKIAARYFSPGENEVLRRLPAWQKQEAFFNCWTRKEAFIKALGEGLSHPLDRFDVAFAPGEAACLLSVAGDSKEAVTWSMSAVSPAPNYVAAVAVKGQRCQLTCWQWSKSLAILRDH